MLQNLAWAGGENLSLEELSRLEDYKQFKEFYSANQGHRWYAVLNGMNAVRLGEINLELNIFANEIGYTLNNLSINDAQIHYVFKQFQEMVLRLKKSTDYYDDQGKYVGKFLWGIFACWNDIKGQLDYDYIQDAIDKL